MKFTTVILSEDGTERSGVSASRRTPTLLRTPMLSQGVLSKRLPRFPGHPDRRWNDSSLQAQVLVFAGQENR